ncbi:MAG: hypothetical protein JNK58_03235 [Phycisphaerae bacterium]|nr:hypothetical protein [Phycisphaerae bacterium]
MTLRDRWNSLPRAGRWLVAAAAFMLAYFVVVEPALDATARAAARADVLQAALDRRRATAAGASDAARNATLAATKFGAALPPGGSDRPAALNACIERVLRDRPVSALAIRTRAMVPLGRAVFAGLIPEGQQAQRLVLDVDFECAPPVAAEILAELEQAPEVTAVGRVIMRKIERDGRRAVQVSLSPETWVITAKRGER